MKYGWRTGAILEEVEDEIGILNSDAFQKTIHWVLNEYILESDDDLYVFLGFFLKLTILQWLIDQLQVRIQKSVIGSSSFVLSISRSYLVLKRML